MRRGISYMSELICAIPKNLENNFENKRKMLQVLTRYTLGIVMLQVFYSPKI